ncbi:uncharacterized protein VTP21DRAFT_5509 [Calcarisporiella thermophila]|uniref:uncharacterized protein n=1 Tax=Calcarisporiella thermophila TaxID=911321 RepID=UPI0037421C57
MVRKAHFVTFFIPIVFATIIIAGLSVRLLLSSQAPAGGLLTWEIPAFAYINNQLVLHVGAAMFNPLPHRQLISPGIVFPPIFGQQPNHQRLSQLFEPMDFMLDGTPNATIDVSTLAEAYATNRNNEASTIRILNTPHEAFWQYTFPRLVVFVFIIGGRFQQYAHDILSSFVYKEPISACVEHARKTWPIDESIGIHLRTWNRDVSLVESKECETIHGHSPLKALWRCDMTYDLVVEHIQRVTAGKHPPILIATDNRDHETVLNLKKRYPTQIYTIDAEELLRSDACLNNPSLFANASRESWMRAHGLSLIENELLAHVDTFIGNGFSTFSYIVAIKRNMHRSHFLQSSMQSVLEQSLAWLLTLSLLVLVLFGILLIRCCARHLRKGRSTRTSSYLPIPSSHA